MRSVLLVKHWKVGRVELLTELSTTTNGKLYIVVFQRFLRPKRTGGLPHMEVQTARNDFDDIKVKEMSQVEVIQLLKRYNNDLEAFIDHAVNYNQRFERIEFTAVHKGLVDMGQLSSR